MPGNPLKFQQSAHLLEMGAVMLHADRTRAALVHGDLQPWCASPDPGVDRRLLECAGGEVALASSIVRYRAGSRFAAHRHDLGEEFVVLEGTFCDEHGQYPAGTYVRNPPGSRHAPSSESGCVIFVKLRQMRADETMSLRAFAEDRAWAATTDAGHERARLFAQGALTVDLERLAPGARWPSCATACGEELFVVKGSLHLVEPELTVLDGWGWSRLPVRRHVGCAGAQGALVWVKRGHL